MTKFHEDLAKIKDFLSMVRFEDYAVFIDSVSRVYWEVTSPSKVDKNEYVSNEMKPKPTYKPF